MMIQRRTWAALSALTLLLGGCTVTADVTIDEDLFMSGKTTLEISRDALGPHSDNQKPCESVARNVTSSQNVSITQPHGRIELQATADTSDKDTVRCDFSFSRWDPNANRRVLWESGDGYVFDTNAPATLLEQLIGDQAQVSFSLTFPRPVVEAPGGTISQNTVSFASIRAFKDANRIVAGDIKDQSLWEEFPLLFILLAAAPVTVFVIFALKRGQIADEEEKS